MDGERAILGALLLDNAALPAVFDALQPEDFYREAHRLIFMAMEKLHQRREPVDWQTLTAALVQSGHFDTVGGGGYLAELVDAVPSAANIMHYVRVVREKAVLRRIMVSASEVAELCAGGQCDLEEIQQTFQKAAFETGIQSAGTKGLVSIKDVLHETIGAIESPRRQGIPTGLATVDQIFDGFFPGDFVILAGRPSMGKSALCADILDRVSMRIPCGFFSVEMPNIQNGMRLLSKKTGLSLRNLRRGLSDPAQISKVMDAAGSLSERLLWIDESSRLTVSHIRNRVQHLEVRTGVKLGLIALDYLQVMTAEGKFQSREREMASFSQGLKLLAKELMVPVLALSQLSRKCEERQGPIAKHPKRPVNSDLRDSGTLEQDADAILFVYRPEMYSDEPCYKGQAQIVVSKQRNGPLGVADLRWEKETATFRDPAPDYREAEQKDDNPASFYEPRETGLSAAVS
jgi:replicative DNA helicase